MIRCLLIFCGLLFVTKIVLAEDVFNTKTPDEILAEKAGIGSGNNVSEAATSEDKNSSVEYQHRMQFLKKCLEQARAEAKKSADKVKEIKSLKPQTAAQSLEKVHSLSKAKEYAKTCIDKVAELGKEILEAPAKAKAEARAKVEAEALDKALVEARAKAKAEAIVRAENGQDESQPNQTYFPYPVYIEEPVLLEDGFWLWYGNRYTP